MSDDVLIGCPCADAELNRALTGWWLIEQRQRGSTNLIPARGEVVTTGALPSSWRWDGERWCQFVQGVL